MPADYVRKQTLANAERYTTPRLKELEDTILNAEDKLSSLEYELFCQIRDAIAEEVERVLTSSPASISASSVLMEGSITRELRKAIRSLGLAVL